MISAFIFKQLKVRVKLSKSKRKEIMIKLELNELENR